PVPRGRTATSTPSRPAIPFATSFTEPSPPTTTRSDAPSSAASRASSVRCPGRSEKSASPVRPAVVAARWISGQRRPVDQFADAGLTRNLVLSGDCGERHSRHAVDRSAQLLVRDPLELALDDDVADREETAGREPAQ